MQTMHAHIDTGTLAGLDDLFFELLLDLGHHFLDTSRMDAAVEHQLMEGQTSHLATHGVEA